MNEAGVSLEQLIYYLSQNVKIRETWKSKNYKVKNLQNTNSS